MLNSKKITIYLVVLLLFPTLILKSAEEKAVQKYIKEIHKGIFVFANNHKEVSPIWTIVLHQKKDSLLDICVSCTIENAGQDYMMSTVISKSPSIVKDIKSDWTLDLHEKFLKNSEIFISYKDENDDSQVITFQLSAILGGRVNN